MVLNSVYQVLVRKTGTAHKSLLGFWLILSYLSLDTVMAELVRIWMVLLFVYCVCKACVINKEIVVGCVEGTGFGW